LPVVATVHDLYAALDINQPSEKKRLHKLRHYEHLRDTCARLICVSENTRQDFLHFVGGDPARFTVVYPGVSPLFRPHDPDQIDAVRLRLNLERPYLLFIGATPNKNLERVVQAFAAGRFGQDFALVVCGQHTPEAQAALAAHAASLGVSAHVLAIGFVSDADLPALYAGAAAYLFPSLYEGYGLPVLEAMASGTPVLTSDRGSCPEAAAGHAVIANPEDVDALAAGIAAAVSMPQAQRTAALAYARTRTWEATARGTLAVWWEVLAEHG
jgi:glycosyltransferase involved in cell wall biosynthesis